MPDRKKDHIELAFKSQVEKAGKDPRFTYEPMLSAHPTALEPIKFLGKKMNAPVWISSMTGGTKMAKKINFNLAKLASEFGLGMGLGSCRSLLYSDDSFADFDVRHIIGEDLPFFANLGICQVEKLIIDKEVDKITELVEKTKTDGLIVHVNPFQEFFQPEGDRLKSSPLELIKELLKLIDIQVIVKEVGQGMGCESLKALLQLPLAAIDFGAFGGTNFSKLEMLRAEKEKFESYSPLIQIGQTAEEMTNDINQLFEEFPDHQNKEIIISGGVKSFLDGYYLTEKCKFNAIYGQGSSFLAYAMEDYETLKTYFSYQLEGLKMAKSYLHIV